jgi:hypothetical protein
MTDMDNRIKLYPEPEPGVEITVRYEGPVRKITTVFFFPNGAIACCDERGEQVVEWQTNLLCDHLRKMREAGVIDKSTKLNVAGEEITAGEYIPWE